MSAYNILLSELAHKKIMYWVNKCDKEVSGFGLVEYDQTKKCFYVTDAFLIEQEVTSSTTDIDEKGFAKLLYQTAKNKGDLNFWWHSHVNMSVFWSGTDMDTIKKLGSNGWIAASVFNKKDEVRSACAYMASSALNNNKPELVVQDDIQTFIEQPLIDADFKAHLDKEFEEKVKIFKPKYGTLDEFMNKHKAKPEITDNDDKSVEAAVVRQFAANNDGELDGQLLQEALQYGLRGYGAEVEAEVLGLKFSQYRRILKKNIFSQMANLEDRLIAAENDGTIDKVLQKWLNEYEAKQTETKEEIPDGKH